MAVRHCDEIDEFVQFVKVFRLSSGAWSLQLLVGRAGVAPTTAGRRRRRPARAPRGLSPTRRLLDEDELVPDSLQMVPDSDRAGQPLSVEREAPRAIEVLKAIGERL